MREQRNRSSIVVNVNYAAVVLMTIFKSTPVVLKLQSLQGNKYCTFRCIAMSSMNLKRTTDSWTKYISKGTAQLHKLYDSNRHDSLLNSSNNFSTSRP